MRELLRYAAIAVTVLAAVTLAIAGWHALFG